MICASRQFALMRFISKFPFYFKEHLGHYSLTIWLGCSLFILIYQIIFLPDPKGKSVEEIQAKFK